MLIYDSNLDFIKEASNDPVEGDETSKRDDVWNSTEKRVTAYLKEYEQKMKTEYEKLTDPTEKEAFKGKFKAELERRAKADNVKVGIVIRGGEVPDEKTFIEEENVYTTVDEMPRFPGCEDETDTEQRKECSEMQLLQHIFAHITYPTEAKDAGIEGLAVVSFVIEANGRITNPKILRSIGYGTDEEVVRVVENMPNWIPGVHEGEAVRVKFNLPIRFRLDE